MKQITYRFAHLLLALVLLCPMLLLTSCEEQKQTGKQNSEADSLINVAYKIRDYQYRAQNETYIKDGGRKYVEPLYL